MLTPETVDSLRLIEIEQGFNSAFIVLWQYIDSGRWSYDEPLVVDEMQRWHFLYGKDYEALCKEWNIDFTIYAVEDTTM